MSRTFKYERRVSWKDTDAAGIVHFSNFFVYMEEAEHAFWKSLGLMVNYSTEEGRFGWPRLSTSCDFKSPARFYDVLEVEVRIVEFRNRILVFEHHVRDGERLCAVGRMTTIHCAMMDNGLKSHPVPESVLEILQPYMPEPSEEI